MICALSRLIPSGCVAVTPDVLKKMVSESSPLTLEAGINAFAAILSQSPAADMVCGTWEGVQLSISCYCSQVRAAEMGKQLAELVIDKGFMSPKTTVHEASISAIVALVKVHFDSVYTMLEIPQQWLWLQMGCLSGSAAVDLCLGPKGLGDRRKKKHISAVRCMHALVKNLGEKGAPDSIIEQLHTILNNPDKAVGSEGVALAATLSFLRPSGVDAALEGEKKKAVNPDQITAVKAAIEEAEAAAQGMQSQGGGGGGGGGAAGDEDMGMPVAAGMSKEERIRMEEEAKAKAAAEAEVCCRVVGHGEHMC